MRVEGGQLKKFILDAGLISEQDMSAAEKEAEKKDTTLKEILLKECSDLINHTINIGSLKMADFDLLQFNLSQIFGKESVTTMMEWARVHLGEAIHEQKKSKKKGIIIAEEADAAYLKSLQAMPQEKLNRLAVSTMFDFSPSARTHEERVQAIIKNRENSLIQKGKFGNFERKLLDASEEAREDAQSTAYRQIGKVKSDMSIVRINAGASTEKFRKRGLQIMSPEGPKKSVRRAEKRIMERKTRIVLASIPIYTSGGRPERSQQKSVVSYIRRDKGRRIPCTKITSTTSTE